MGRPLRIEYPGALYHITSRGNEKKDIFLKDKDRKKFLSILADYHDRYRVLTHCYVLMKNHYHLVLETPLGNLLKVMHGINSAYTGYFNREYGRVGHLFQGRYRAIVVDRDAYLLELSRYVHLNPVRAGVVGKPERYRWSSYLGYIRKEEMRPWVEYRLVLSQCGEGLGRSRREYKRYVEREDEEEEERSPLAELYGQVLLGTEEFVERLKGLVKGKVVNEEIVERRRLKERPRAAEIVQMVAEEYGEEPGALRKRGRNKTARKVAIYVMKRYSGLSNRDIAKEFGGVHYTAVTKTCARLEVEMKRDRKLRKAVQEVMSYVKT
jgi:REP element-mobilizing transposase RayT